MKYNLNAIIERNNLDFQNTLNYPPISKERQPFRFTEQVGKWQQEEERNIWQYEDEVPNAMNEWGVEPFDVPRTGVGVQDLVGDGGNWQEQSSANGYRNRKGANGKRDL